MTGILLRTDPDIQGEGDSQGRDWSAVPMSQRLPAIQELEEVTKDASLVPPWRVWSCPNLDFGGLASRTVRESTRGLEPQSL